MLYVFYVHIYMYIYVYIYMCIYVYIIYMFYYGYRHYIVTMFLDKFAFLFSLHEDDILQEMLCFCALMLFELKLDGRFTDMKQGYISNCKQDGCICFSKNLYGRLLLF